MKDLGNSLIVVALIFISVHCHAESSDKVLHRERRLINGTPVPGGLPFMAVLAYKNGLMDERPYLVVCGATLIDDRNVLSAAHCFDPDITPVRDGATLFVVLGLQDNSFGACDNVQEFPIDDVAAESVLHPDFNVNLVFNNDIALIRLKTPAVVNALVAPVDLPPADIDELKIRRCDFYGWGVTGEPITDAVFTQFLRTARLRLLKINRCQRFYLGFLNPEQHICATSRRGEDTFPCAGDSGSPMVCRFQRKPVLTGFNSFRQRGPCDIGSPQAFTKISCFLEWIAANKETESH